MTVFERHPELLKSDSVNVATDSSSMRTAGTQRRWDWHTFSGDPADIWDHSACCDICGHVFSSAGARR